MKHSVMRVLVALVFTVPCVVGAALSGPSTPHTISELRMDNRFSPARVVVFVNEPVHNPESCPSPRYSFALDSGGEAMYSMLLAAKAANIQVQFWVDGCFDNAPHVKITEML